MRLAIRKSTDSPGALIISQFSKFVLRLGSRPTLCLGQPEEELFAVSKGNVSADGASGTILRLVAFDCDVGSRRKGFLRQPESVQIVRAGAFDHPGDRLAIGPLDVNVNPGVRVG